MNSSEFESAAQDADLQSKGASMVSISIRITASLALSLMWAALATSQTPMGPPVPYEDVGACPFEGCKYREWQANAAVELHAECNNGSATSAKVAKGEKVQALGGLVVTIKASRVLYDKSQELSTDAGPVEILPGQTLFLLTYLGEGNSKAWLDGRLYKWVDISNVTRVDGGCGFGDSTRCTGREVEKSQTEWWVEVRTASGKVGWTRETTKFDGKDALGR